MQHMYFHEPTGQCYELYKQGKNILELSSYHFMYLFVYIYQVPVQKEGCLDVLMDQDLGHK